MNANELADKLSKWYEDFDGRFDLIEDVTTMLRQQQDQISVLDANHKIQLDINEKALQYIEQLEQGLQASINLNRAQEK